MLIRYLRVLMWMFPRGVRARHAKDFQAFWSEQFLEVRYAGVIGRVRFFVTVSLDAAFLAIRMRVGMHSVNSRANLRRNWIRGVFSNIRLDASHAVRAMHRSPLFTFVAVATLGLGIGATTTVFSVVSGVLLRPLPFDQPEQLVNVHRVTAVGTADAVSWPDFRDWQSAPNSGLHGLAAYSENGVTLQRDESAEALTGMLVTRNIFDVLGIPLALGRSFTEEEVAFHGPEAIVLGHAIWMDRFGGDPSVLGQTLMLDGESVPVVGVAAAGFLFPDRETQYWMPLHEDRLLEELGFPTGRRSLTFLSVIARLNDDVSLEGAQARLANIVRGIDQTEGSYRDGYTVALVGMLDLMVGDVRTTLMFVFGAVSLVLLVACANIAGLSLGRAAGRSREMALRLALGASRARIAMQVFTENLVMSVVAGAVGIAISVGAVGLVVSLVPPGLPRIDEIRLHPSTLAFGVVATMLSGLLLGVLPAMQLASRDAITWLRASGRSVTGGRHALRTQRGLVIGQVALSVVLMVGAALLARSYALLTGVDRGFESEGIVIASVSPTMAEETPPQQIDAFYSQLLDRVRAMPGITAATSTYSPPLAGNGFRMTLSEEGEPEVGDGGRSVETVIVRDDYFRTMGIPLLAGRVFDTGDRLQSVHVAVVNETMARQFWPGQDPVGKQLVHTGGIDGSVGSVDRAFFPREPYTVVGVVGDTRDQELGRPPGPTWYRPHTQLTWAYQYLVIATQPNAGNIAGPLRELVWLLDPTVAVATIRTLDSQLTESVALPRFRTLMFGSFAVVACLLSAIGVYSVIALSVVRRQREIGIKLALGADTARVVRQTMGSGGRMVATGAALGLGVALVGARFLSTMLYEVTPSDPLTFLLVLVTVGGIALAACFVPAVRAGRVDPAQSLRHD